MIKRVLCNLVLAFLFATTVDAHEIRQYQIHIDLPNGGTISGICILRMDEKQGTMSVLNEFGMKAFDAVYSIKKDKVKLQNAIRPLNKWYIRRVIAKDMAVLFNSGKQVPKRRTFSQEKDGSIVLDNRRFNIIYHLKPITHVTE